MALPLHKRYEIIFLHEHPQGPQWGYEKIATHIGCTKNTAKNWILRWRISKDLSDQKKSGPRRRTTAKQDKQITKMAKMENSITSIQIQRNMEKRGVNISARTIRRRLREAGGKYTNAITKPLLTENHRKKRLQWAKRYQNFDWNQVIFTDESTFQLFPSKKKVWQFIERKKVFRTVKHPPKVHVWGCFSVLGFGELVCFQRNLDANFMCEIYKKGLLPSVSEFFGEGNLDWFLQEDNDPKHRSRIAKNWKAEKGIKELPWPSMSPDQNPIENVWHVMKLNLKKKKIHTVNGLKGELTKEWNRLPSEFAAKLVDSMKRRIMALIESNGDYTMY
jgi:transposase